MPCSTLVCAVTIANGMQVVALSRITGLKIRIDERPHSETWGLGFRVFLGLGFRVSLGFRV